MTITSNGVRGLDDLLSSGSKSFKFDQPGDTVTGTVVSAQTRQATEFGTGKPLTWDDGRPQEQVVITVQTTLEESADDDGRRTIYIKGWGKQLNAFRMAVQRAGAKPKPGDTFTARFTGFGPKSDRGGFPPKEFTYELTPGNASLDSLLDGAPQQRAQENPWNPPAAQQPAQTPQQAPQSESAGITTAKNLIAAGVSDDVIRQAVPGLDLSVLAALRAAQ